MAGDMAILQYLEAGIRAGGARQKALANNLANINTPGYRRYDVSFEDVLNKAIDSGDSAEVKNLSLDFIQPKNTPVNAMGNDVVLDKEAGELLKNSLRHQAYTALLKKKYDNIKAAIQVS